MFWMGTAVALMIAGIVALIVLVLGKRPADLGKLGSVSDPCWLLCRECLDTF